MKTEFEIRGKLAELAELADSNELNDLPETVQMFGFALLWVLGECEVNVTRFKVPDQSENGGGRREM